MDSLQLLDRKTVGLTAHSANKIIFYSHLKPLVHSFCSPSIMQFALLWLLCADLQIFMYLHPVTAGLKCLTKTERQERNIWGFFCRCFEQEVQNATIDH